MRLVPKAVTLKTITAFNSHGGISTSTEMVYSGNIIRDTNRIARTLTRLFEYNPDVAKTLSINGWQFELRNYRGGFIEPNKLRVTYDSIEFRVKLLYYNDREMRLTLFCEPTKSIYDT